MFLLAATYDLSDFQSKVGAAAFIEGSQVASLLLSHPSYFIPILYG